MILGSLPQKKKKEPILLPTQASVRRRLDLKDVLTKMFNVPLGESLLDRPSTLSVQISPIPLHPLPSALIL